MQLGRICGALGLLFAIVLSTNIVIYNLFSPVAFLPVSLRIAPSKNRDYCISLVLNNLNMSEVNASSSYHSPVLKLAIPPYPVSQMPVICRKLFEPLHVNRAVQTAKEEACYLRNNFDSHAKAVIRSNVLRLVQAFKHEKIDLLLDSGSLLGSWRHHGIIPYDDDIDFRIRYEDKPRIRKLFIRLCARYGDCRFRDTERENQHWKLDIGCKNLNRTELSCFMQLDFFFFWIESNLITVPEPPYSYPKSVFYPLIVRPFEGVLVHTVRDYPRYYRATYNSDNLTECRSYDHKGHSRCTHSRIDCNMLQPFHPFVRSFYDYNNGVLEFQINKRKIIDVFYRPY